MADNGEKKPKKQGGKKKAPPPKTYDDFMSEIKKGLPETAYLLFGPEEFLKEHCISLARKAVIGDSDFADFNIIETDENNYTEGFLLDALESAPFMAERLLIICRVRLSKLSRQGGENCEKSRFVDTVSHLKEKRHACTLIVCPSGYHDNADGDQVDLYTELYDLIGEYKMDYAGDAMLRKWLTRHFNADGIKIDYPVLSLILNLCGSNMNSLLGEKEKLVCYVKSSGRDTVTPDDVLTQCTDSKELNTFALSNAIREGNRKEALKALKQKIDAGARPEMISAAVTGDITKMLLTAIYLKEGLTLNQIMNKMKIAEYPAKLNIAAVKNKDIRVLQSLLKRCFAMDRQIKTSNRGFLAIEQLICTIPAGGSR